MNKELEDYDFKILKMEKRSVLIQNYNLSQMQNSKNISPKAGEEKSYFHNEAVATVNSKGNQNTSLNEISDISSAEKR